MDKHAKELLHSTLRSNGHSVTAARELLFKLMWDQEPLSMRELFVHAAGRLDRASLFRIISLFERIGIVQRLYVGWKYKLELTDIFSRHHHHISCLGCGQIIAIAEDDEVERLIKTLAIKHHVVAERHQLEIQGYCQECRTKSNNGT